MFKYCRLYLFAYFKKKLLQKAFIDYSLKNRIPSFLLVLFIQGQKN